MDIALSYPEAESHSGDSEARKELECALDAAGAPLIDQVKYPGKSPAQIRRLKYIERLRAERDQELKEMGLKWGEYQLERMALAKQAHEDQHLIAENIRNGQLGSALATPESPQPLSDEEWVSSSEAIRRLNPLWAASKKLQTNFSAYPWAEPYRRPMAGFVRRYEFEIKGLEREVQRHPELKPPRHSHSGSNVTNLGIALSGKRAKK